MGLELRARRSKLNDMLLIRWQVPRVYVDCVEEYLRNTLIQCTGGSRSISGME